MYYICMYYMYYIQIFDVLHVYYILALSRCQPCKYLSIYLSRVSDINERVGYLINMHSSELLQEEDKRLMACVDYFFIQVIFLEPDNYYHPL